MTFTFSAKLAARDFDVELTMERGETVAVLGPNGAGKSTLVNLVAGLIAPDTGYASLDEKVLFDFGPGARRLWQPPHRRQVSLLTQDALLFPHLTVLKNVAYGPRSAGARKAMSREVAHSWLAEVDAAEFAQRKPAQLSGGQAQRIAVARALAAQPQLLLLDEPLAALDIAVAPAMRRMLRRVLENRTAIIVTHDILDALTLADRVVVLDKGRVVEVGPTREVLERPRDPFTADIAGLNLLVGTKSTRGLEMADGITVPIPTVATHLANGLRMAIAVRPSAVTVSTGSAGRARDIELVVHDIEPRGDVIRIRAGCFVADVTPVQMADLDVSIGSSVWVGFDEHAAEAYPFSREG